MPETTDHTYRSLGAEHTHKPSAVLTLPTGMTPPDTFTITFEGKPRTMYHIPPTPVCGAKGPLIPTSRTTCVKPKDHLEGWHREAGGFEWAGLG